MNTMRLEFMSESKNERFARTVVSAFVLELDPTVQELSELKTAVSEAVTNSVIHGYGEKSGIIILEGLISDNEIKLTVTDKGKGIRDIPLAMEPLYTEAPEAERSGLGFTIMQTFMDELTVWSSPGQGTRVTMTKRIKG